MPKVFNTTGPCFESVHYMVNIEKRLDKIINDLIDKNLYFTITRARQYGKTTLLNGLAERLAQKYAVLLLSFEELGADSYLDEAAFCRGFLGLLKDRIELDGVTGLAEESVQEMQRLQSGAGCTLKELSTFLFHMCRSACKPIVLIIDEVDQASNNRIFLDFLGLLRNMYLKRMQRRTFQSVILAGVYDVRNLRVKIRPDEDHKYNSPWNIAVNFDLDMSFSVQDIEGMLSEYERDHCTGMDISNLSELIYEYTSGYPYLVSRICQLMDEATDGVSADMIWTKAGVLEAVKQLLQENNTLFDDMSKKLADMPQLSEMLKAILFNGKSIPFNPDEYATNLGVMFGYLKNQEGVLAVTNRIFETRLYNRFIAEEVVGSAIYDAASLDKNQFIAGGMLDMDLVMAKFQQHFTEIYGDSTERFVEENGRRIFLTYLRPIINGVGNYYIEARTRDMRRTDVIIDYKGQQFIVEMKIWRGEEYSRRGEMKLAGYLGDYRLDKGYLLSFNFNKNKVVGTRSICCGGKTILETTV